MKDNGTLCPKAPKLLLIINFKFSCRRLSSFDTETKFINLSHHYSADLNRLEHNYLDIITSTNEAKEVKLDYLPTALRDCSKVHCINVRDMRLYLAMCASDSVDTARLGSFL